MTKKTNAKTTPETSMEMSHIDNQIEKHVNSKVASTARYFTFTTTGAINSIHESVCFNSISSHCGALGRGGLGLFFQGYGGFDENNRDPKLPGQDRWRDATEADLYTNKPIPFQMIDGGHYNKVSLAWLEALLNPEGPFKSLLPVMYETDPEKVHARRAFIFPDVSLIPARLAWCFAIASRLGFANPRVVWRYLHLLDKGLDKVTALLIAGGFEHEVKSGEITGRIIKSYTCGYLGVDVTAYAGRFLSCSPVVDEPGASRHGTYGSSKVFESGRMDLKQMTFDDWDEVIAYTQARGVQQSEALEKKAA